MNRVLGAAPLLLGAALLGCGGGKAELPSTPKGAIVLIEGAVEDISATIMDPNYKGTRSRDAGTDSDRIGLALAALKKEAAGTPLAADADEIAQKVADVEKLMATRAPVEKQREAVKALKDAVAAAKAKM